jgi:hypothetical protein
MEFVLNNERQQFALTHHDLRVARLRRDKEMKAKAIEDERKLELTFKPQINEEYQLKNKDDDFFQRLEKYEQSRKLKMAELHKEEWKRLQKETEKINLLSPRSHYILNKKKVRDTDNSSSANNNEEDNDDDNNNNNKSIRIREQNFVDTNRIDWKTGDQLFQPKINQRSKDLICDGPSDRYGTGSTSKNVGEMLYRNAFNRKLRKVLAQRRLDEYDEFMRNKSKASKRTMTIMKKALMRDIEVAFHATTGLRNETSSLNDSIGFRSNSLTVSTNNRRSPENKNKKGSVFSSPFDDDDDNNNYNNSFDINVLYETEELLHTMYILNFIPSFASNYTADDSDSNIQSIKDMKDNEFIERLWNALATKGVPAGKSSIGENTTTTTTTTSSTTSFLELAKLKQFLLNVIYPNADGNKKEGERKGPQQEMQTKAPVVVNISLSLDSDDEENDTLNKDADIKHSNVDEAEINKQHLYLYNSMLREVRFLYKKIMPSGYRSLESRQRKEKILNPSPSSSPKNTRKSSNKTSVRGKKETHIHSLEAKELEECTFKPKINKYKKSKVPVDVKNKNKNSCDATSSANVSITSKSNKSRREDILLAKHKLTKGKHALARKNQREFEARECTFQPDLSLSRKSLQSLSKSEGGGKNPNRKKKLVEEVTLTTEEREYRKHCTFTPKFVSKSIPTNYYRNKSGGGSSSNKYKQKKTPNKKNVYGLHDGWLVQTSPDKSHHTPRAYEQAISRMRQARAKRNETKYLEDVHATLRSGHRTSPSKDLPDDHRDARGRLRSKPFKFSTKIRHEHRAHQSALKKLGYRGTNGRLLQYSRGTDPFTGL